MEMIAEDSLGPNFQTRKSHFNFPMQLLDTSDVIQCFFIAFPMFKMDQYIAYTNACINSAKCNNNYIDVSTNRIELFKFFSIRLVHALEAGYALRN